MRWHVWTDGSCVHDDPQAAGSCGWGGWCAIVEHGSSGQMLRGREPDTTAVRMELRAAIRGLEVVPDGARAVLHTDTTCVLSVVRWSSRGTVRVRDGLRPDLDLWVLLADQLGRVAVSVDLLERGVRDPIHRRCHSFAGAEARGGLRNLPAHATPLEDGHHRIRKGMRRRVA